ncbi:CPBP family intramembrane metalloprotease [Candidatus Micrarchaeota archaeon]|nr:CPBP family intramembrane metalloprotease [Candidatus Micrarchaeota archaeon]
MDFFFFSFPRFLEAAGPALFFLLATFGALSLEGRRINASLRAIHLDPSYWKNPLMMRRMLVHAFILLLALLVISFVLSFLFYLVGYGDLHRIESLLKTQPFFVLLIAVTLSPVAEEVFFRGYLQGKVGVLFSAAVFGMLHAVYGSVVEVFGAFGIALLLGTYVLNERNLYPCILSHALFNFISIYAVFA